MNRTACHFIASCCFLVSVVPTRDTGSTATRSTYRRPRGGGTLLPSKFTKHSHLDTIRQNYHI